MWKPFYYICKGLYAVTAPFYPVKVINKEKAVKKGRYIYACNHLANMDIPITVVHLPGLRRYVAKNELKKKFFIGTIFTWFGCLFIDRESPKMSEMKAILKWLDRDEQILIFPEGTRNKTGDEKHMTPFKGGMALFAGKSGAPVIPVLIYKKPGFFRRNYLYVGDPIDIIQEKGRFPSAKNIQKYTDRYELEFERQRIIFEDIVKNKRWKKKNRLGEGEKCEALSEWEKEHGYGPFVLEEE